MNIKHAFAVIASCASIVASAKTNYVNKSLSDYTDHDGSTPELALRTIQEAVTAAESGDWILVAPGDYGADQGVHENAQRGKSRVYVPSGKNLRIVATGGAGETAIVGAHDTTTTSGFGDNAVRCVDVESANNFANTVLFEGFTLRDGATKDTTSWDGTAGAVLATVVSDNPGLIDPRCGSFIYGAYLVDCVISNCIGAKIQLTVGCTHIRCRIQGNAFVKPDGKNIQIDGVARYLNCLITHNRTVSAATGATTTDSAYIYNSSRFVNCSFVDNLAGYYCWGGPGSYCQFYNCLDALSYANHSDGSVGNRFCHVTDTSATQNTMAPSLGDYRLHAGCAALTAGEASFVTNKTLISHTPHFTIDYSLDIDGKPIAAEGAIASGCSQASVTAAAGAVVGSDKYVEFGPRAQAQQAAAWVWPTAYPTNYTVSVRTNDEGRIYSYLLDADGITSYADLASHIVYPTDYKHDTLTFRPHPTDATTVGYKRATPGNADCKLIYLNAETEEAEGSQDGTAAHPYRKLTQAAATVGYNKYAVFVAAPGDYDEGIGSTSVNGYTIRGRLALDDRGARLVAVEGPATTAIVGAPDSGTLATADKGCGPNAVGITALKRGEVAIQGFTLRDAYSGTGTYAEFGVCYSYEPDRLVIMDSVLANCTGKTALSGAARFVRTRMTGNTGVNGFFPTGIKLVSCIVDNSTIDNASGFYFPSYTSYTALCYGLTMVADGQHYVFFNDSKATFYNSIFAGGGAVNSRQVLETFAGCVLSGFKAQPWTTGVTYADDPMLLATSGKDSNFRVFTGSVAEGVGTYSVDNLTGPLRQYANLDYSGAVRAAAVAGAYGTVCNEGAYVSSGAGVSVVGGKVGYNELKEGDVLSFGYAAGSTRPLAGYAVDGVTNLVEKPTDVISVTYAGEPLLVTPVYSNDWYVDDVNGNDTTGLGYNPSCAFKTLKKGLSNASLKAKDRVMVAPGTYDDETMIQTGDFVLKARAVVPANVTLKATGTAEETEIVGAPCTPGTEDAAPGASYAGHMTGYGKDAIRGVYLSAGATLEGFTVRNGYTRGSNDEGKPMYAEEDSTGGAVRSADATAKIVRCRLVGNHAFRGGALYYGTAVDCLFSGNEALYAGGASSGCHLYGSLSVGNTCATSPRNRSHDYWYHLENCTLLDSLNGTGWVENGHNIGVMKNCLCRADDYTWWSGNGGYPASSNVVNCVFVPPVNPYDGNSKYVYDRIIPAIEEGDNIVTTLENVQIDEDGRPIIGANVAIDAGDASLNSAYVGAEDLSGVQRVYNGTMDIGALEADWRETYAKDIGRKRVVVTAASANVVESDNKKVVLNDGSTLSLLADKSESYLEMSFLVSGGELTVTVDGVPTVYTAGETVRIPQNEGYANIDFAFAGSGNATILSVDFRKGLVITIR